MGRISNSFIIYFFSKRTFVIAEGLLFKVREQIIEISEIIFEKE
jgi:hypothetical protein